MISFLYLIFKNIHKICLYDTDGIQENLNTKQLLYLFENVLYWNIGIYDIEILRHEQFDQLNEFDLFSPLLQKEQYISSIDCNLEKWNEILLHLDRFKKLKSFAAFDWNTLSKENQMLLLHYFNQYINKDRYLIDLILSPSEKEILHENMDFMLDFNEKHYQQFCHVYKKEMEDVQGKLLYCIGSMPRRGDQWKKIDFYVRFIYCLYHTSPSTSSSAFQYFFDKKDSQKSKLNLELDSYITHFIRLNRKCIIEKKN